MIVREFYRTRKDGVNLYKTHSDSNLYIQKVGTNEIYTVTVDVENAPFEYVETTEEIKSREENKKRVKK